MDEIVAFRGLQPEAGRPCGCRHLGRGHFEHGPVCAVATIKRVIAKTADQRVIATLAVQPVTAGAAKQTLSQLVANQGQPRRALHFEAFDIVNRAEREIDRGADHVKAVTRPFVDPVASIVDVIDIIPGVAVHVVGATFAVQHVVAGIAPDQVVGVGPDQVDHVGRIQIGGAQLLDLVIGAQRDAEIGKDPVVPLPRRLDDAHVGRFDIVGIVARPAAHLAAVVRVVRCA
ncbi:hypothetical protein TRM7615_04819 [Falsiruegeria mediterranea M17]|uniref:Uncharacterized protein n=1 Tax=Falsiruegeria mediterranea M17 TaxID=1200281 RepID=A0A2R8CFT9_9RHOB|nr:hypothetical protein TRM7615_04819 [Falsiruegeria mediterranea M17]